MKTQYRWNRLLVGIAALVLLICAGSLRSGAELNAGVTGNAIALKVNDRGALNRRAQSDDLKLTDEDRAEIVSQMLKREIARIKEERAKYDKRRKGILTLTLSTQNLKPSLVPSIPGVKFILIEPEEIEKRIKEALGISYLAFDTFEVKGPVVTVSLSNVDRGPGRIRAFIYIKQNKYEYRKEDGKWVGKLINSGALISD
ncbi:MAG: hypothetical protein M3R69_05420 [Acidobacteriota bacterium]|nr:hypothetical protein [Acidobacteriota bacterium]